MKKGVFLLVFLLSLLKLSAIPGYYYAGQYFIHNSLNKTAQLIAPIDGTSYKGDFKIHNWFPISFEAYRVNRINDKAFYKAQKLTSVTFGNHIIEVGASAFQDCCELQNVVMNDSLKVINNYAFSGCGKLTSINFPSLLEYIGLGAFKLTKQIKTVNIPKSVTLIDEFAFFASGLKRIDLSSEKLRVKQYAFNLTNIDTVNISSIENWCNYKFETIESNPSFFAKVFTLNNEEIIDVDLRDVCVDSIFKGAFIKVNSLKNIIIGETIKYISEKAFYSNMINTVKCTRLVPPEMESNAFTDLVYYKAELIVPKGSLQDYKLAKGWSRFVNIREFEDISSGIEEVNVSNNKFTINSRQLQLDKPEYIEVYKTNGELVYKGTTLSLYFSSPGFYIINGTKFLVN